jgi:predicted RNase H-like HicB family nuclease
MSYDTAARSVEATLRMPAAGLGPAVDETRTYQVVVAREDEWWMITVPELDAVTQARCVDEIEYMARDLIAICLEVEDDSFAVDVDLRVPSCHRAELAAAEWPDRA